MPLRHDEIAEVDSIVSSKLNASFAWIESMIRKIVDERVERAIAAAAKKGAEIKQKTK